MNIKIPIQSQYELVKWLVGERARFTVVGMMISLFIHGVVRVPKIWCYCKRFPTAKCDQTGTKLSLIRAYFKKSANIFIENNPHVFENGCFQN